MTAAGFEIVFRFSGLAVHSLAEIEFGERKIFATFNVQHVRGDISWQKQSEAYIMQLS